MTPRAALTDAELAVLRHAANGLTQAQIARKLKLSDSTISSRARSATKKLRAKNLTHAVTLALRQGLIDGDA